ncbi:hypothetical protein DIPPA_22963 [Diplonema papillatum]|nr:hypothetical protein DIPPA_22963 [Diplonema papillatum]
MTLAPAAVCAHCCHPIRPPLVHHEPWHTVRLTAHCPVKERRENPSPAAVCAHCCHLIQPPLVHHAASAARDWTSAAQVEPWHTVRLTAHCPVKERRENPSPAAVCAHCCHLIQPPLVHHAVSAARDWTSAAQAEPWHTVRENPSPAVACTGPPPLTHRPQRRAQSVVRLLSVHHATMTAAPREPATPWKAALDLN